MPNQLKDAWFPGGIAIMPIILIVLPGGWIRRKINALFANICGNWSKLESNERKERWLIHIINFIRLLLTICHVIDLE